MQTITQLCHYCYLLVIDLVQDVSVLCFKVMFIIVFMSVCILCILKNEFVFAVKLLLCVIVIRVHDFYYS